MFNENHLKNLDDVEKIMRLGSIEDTVMYLICFVISIMASLAISKFIFIASAIILIFCISKVLNIVVYTKRIKLRREIFDDVNFNDFKTSFTEQVNILGNSLN